MWNRGLCFLEDRGELFVGSAPASIHRIDLAGRRIVETIPLAADLSEAVHGVLVIPDGP